MRRAAVPVILLCALLTTGCVVIRSTRWMAPRFGPNAAPDDPDVQLLRDAAAKSRGQSAHESSRTTYGGNGCSYSGGGWGTETDLDPVNKLLDTSIVDGSTKKPYFRIIHEDLYLHAIEAHIDSNREWVHFDLGRVSSTSWLRSTFSGGAIDPVKGFATAVKLADGVYAGTIDLILLQANTTYSTPKADLGNQIEALGPKDAAAVPFVARVDDAGRLTYLELTTKRAAGKDSCLTTQVTAMSDLGHRVSVEAPADYTVQEATEAQYRQLS